MGQRQGLFARCARSQAVWRIKYRGFKAPNSLRLSIVYVCVGGPLWRLWYGLYRAGGVLYFLVGTAVPSLYCSLWKTRLPCVQYVATRKNEQALHGGFNFDGGCFPLPCLICGKVLPLLSGDHPSLPTLFLRVEFF